MGFIEPELNSVVKYLKKLDEKSVPIWGSLTPLGMIEHLTDSLNMAIGNPMEKIEVHEKHWNKMIAILNSDAAFPKNFKVSFAPENRIIRNKNIIGAILEFEKTWTVYEETFSNTPKLITNHPNYGPLNKQQWDRMLRKHLTHHLMQFGLISDQLEFEH
ncbi:MAG: hypothetical protein P8K10_07825 [Crocinitomicaceae bacterium]|nr:hypothetical protein [Crocinitomicaceae bacterium]